MRHVVVKLKIVVNNGVVCMIKLEEVLQGSCSLFMLRLNLLDWNRFEIDCCPRVASQEAGQSEGIGE